MEAILTATGLKKYYGKGETQVRALDGVDLEIERGKFTAIIGTSGSGKSTLLNMLGGLDTPTERSIRIGNTDLARLPTDAFRAQWPENTLRRLFVNVEDSHVNGMQEWLNTYIEEEDSSLPVTSRSSMAEQYKRETRSSAVMGNAISIIIALVGVLNFINSMVTAIVSRGREFAMIQSVGMTKKQLCRMLVYEGSYYAAITLTASYLISAAAVGVGIRAMVEGGFTTFRFTLFPLVICTPILIVFAVLIPYLCFKNLEKRSIVERLRTE